MVKISRFTLCIFISFTLTVISSTYYCQNILSNGGFEEGQGDWSTYFGTSLGYNGNLSIITSNVHSGSKAARISVTQVPTSPQALKVQLKNNIFHVEAGHSYHVSLWLKANQNVDVQIILVQNTTPYAWLGAKTISLSTTYQMFDLQVNNAPFTTDNDVRFAIRCGNAVAEIFVDDVVITDCTAPTNYHSLHTSVTGKGTVNINHSLGELKCIESCNDQFQNGDIIVLNASAEQGYIFSGWSGACSGNGSCTITMDQIKYVGAHFTVNSVDNSCIDYRNRTDWTEVGYEGVIPYDGNIIDMTQPPYSCNGNGTYNNYQALLDVLDDVKTMSGFNIIYFPSGTYYIEGQESFFIPDNTVIRGNCSSNTILEINSTVGSSPYINNKIFRIEQIGSQATKFGPETPLLGGYHIGSNSLTIEDETVIEIGDFIEIRQHNDTIKMDSDLVPGDITTAKWEDAYTGSAWDAVGEIAKVIDKNGNTLFLDRGLHFTYDPKLFPMIKRIGLVENVGIENIKIYRPNGTKDNMNIAIERAYNCWVRNVESSWAMKCHVSLVRSYHCEIRDNYIHHAYDYGGGGHGYGVSINHRATSCLIEHNVFNTLRHAMVLSYGPIGNVCGYNFSRVSYDPCGTTVPIIGTCIGDVKADISLHGFYPLMNLFEGNIVEYMHSSDWWGPSGPGNTFFRNRASQEAFYISDNSHYQNVIGNELTYNPVGWADNFEIDASVNHTTKHSNNDLGNIDVNKISTLPNSLYKTSPNFNFGFPIPNIGPVSGINPSGDYPYDMHDNKPKYRYYNSTYKAPCTAICATNLIDEYSSCETSVDLVLPVENTVKILYGITIEDIPNTYGGGTEGNPEIYIKMYTNGGTLVFSSENSYISAVPDIYISCDYLPIDVNETYHVYVYDDDGSTSADDFLGTVSFQGSSNSSYFYDYISGQLLQINLNKESYNTQYEWNTGSQSNSITVNQSGTYSAIVTNYFGCESEDSTVVILASSPQISSQTLTSQEICIGSTINPFSVNITGGIDLTYQWYNNSINSTTGGNPISSATNSTYQPNNSNTGNFYYYCLIGDTNTACTDVYSSIATIQINEPLTITNQPILAQSTCTNGNINPLSISISGGGTITYQWYENTLNSTNGGTLISGSNSSSYTPPSNTSGTMYYYCVISSSGTGCNNINSDIAEITIIPPINISSQPLILQEVCLGSSLIDVSITSTGGNNPNYQWYNNSINSNSGGTIIIGATASSYSPPSNTIGEFYYYCTITSSITGCNSMTSDVSEIIIHEPNSISQHPTSYEEICINDNNINIQLAASGNNNTYQWYQNNSSSYSGGQLIVGAVASNYNPSSVSPDTIYYFCIVSNTNSTCPNDTTLITTVNFLDYPAASFSYLDSALTVEFSNSSTNSNQFEWIFGDGTSSISTDPSHQYQSSGSYTVYLIAENSCNSDTTMQIITLTVSNIEELEAVDFIIYPNPASGKCIIDLMNSLPNDGCLQLIDLTGKLVLEKNINNRLTEFDLNSISSGEYVIIYSAKDLEIIKKLIVQ